MLTARLLLVATLLAFVPPPASAADACSSLPTSALRPRACNPRAECLRDIPKDLGGERRDARRKECEHQPTSGTCYGPATYNPQAECRARQKK